MRDFTALTPNCFSLGQAIHERPKEILYVGQLIYANGRSLLWSKLFRASPTCGAGMVYLRVLRDWLTDPDTTIYRYRCIRLEGFRGEADVAAAMRNARFVCTSQLSGALGMVLAEAA